MIAFRKALSAGLVATLLVAQQGPLFYQVLAQTVAASASGASSGSLGASAGSLQTGGSGSLGSGPRSVPSLVTGVSPLPSVPTLTPVLNRGLQEAARASAVGLSAQGADIVRERAPAPVLRAAAPNLELPTAAGPVSVDEAHPLGKISVHASASAESAEKTADSEDQGKHPGMLSQLSAFGKTLAQAGRSSGASLLAKAFDRSKQTSDTAEDADRVEAGEELGTKKRAGLSPVDRGLTRGSAASEVLGAAGGGQADWLRLKALKRVLGDGTDSGKGAIGPFGFKTPQDTWNRARSAGLEGFFYAKLEHERAWGEKASLAQLKDYFSYLDALLAPASQVSEVHDLRSGLKALAASQAAPLEKNRELNALLVAGLNLLRARAASLDKASWGRSAGIYMVLARAYNRLRPGKGFFESFDEAEFERIRKTTRADTLWLLDIYEIGAPRRWGTGGGSPYSISGYRVKKELGGDEALKRFTERAHKAGMRVMTDFIPNHTSLDSELIKERPEAVLHIVPPQHLTDAEIMAGVPRESFGPRSPVFYLVETDNYPENGRRVHKKILVHHPRTDYGDVMWIDMAQIDYSRADARDWEIEQARRVFEDLGVDAVRRDMAYEQTNARFFHRWVKILEMEKDTGAPWAKGEMERLISEFKVRWAERGGAEFWEQFSDATKSRFPASFAIDEVYSNSTEMSRAGSDGVYNKNTHDESMGQVGLYDAMVSRDAGRIRAALRNMAFRAWQRGGAGLVNFIGTHDGGEGNPWDKFGMLGRAAAATALLFRPVLIYNGVEQGVGQARNVRGDLSKSVDREKAIPFDIPVAIDWSQREGANADFLEMVLGKSAEHADILTEGAAEVLEPEGGTPIVAYTIGRKRGKTLLVAANFSESPAGARFKLGTPVLKDFGAFEPKAGKTYLLRDFADIQRDGSPKEYRRTGDELLKDGITILLGPGGTHVMEVSELDAAAPATGPPQKTQAPQGGTILEEAGIDAPIEGSSEKGASPKKAPFWKASWADWTQRLTAFSMVPFALLQLPQILKNVGNLAAGNAAALSGLPWMGYSTGILGNMLLLSYFSSQKEKSAAAVQAVGVLESAIVVTQIFLAGFMPAAAFAVVMPVVAAGLVLNALKAFGKLPDKVLAAPTASEAALPRVIPRSGVPVWMLWNKFLNILGFFALPMGFAMSFGLAQAHMAASLAASLALAGAGLYLIVREAQGKMDKLPPALQWVWKKIGAALASLLFMFGPVSQLMNNVGNPAGMAGISVETLLLAMAGNLLMLPRALFVKDKLWFAGSSWGAWVGGWAVLLTMMLAGYLSPLFFGSATAALASYMGFILYKSRPNA